MYIVQRAIIMAAGKGTRLHELTSDTPKPLIIVHNQPMIEGLIEQLLLQGLDEILIVVGYMKEKFSYLATKYSEVQLIENPFYDTTNNISSLYMVRDFLENAMILDGDLIIKQPEILHRNFEHSGYAALRSLNATNEWLLQVKENKITSCSRIGGKDGWILYSISRWTKEDGIKLKKHLEQEFLKKNTSVYWDDVAMFEYFSEYDLYIDPIPENSVIEIDNMNELILEDPSYLKKITKQ
jgi:CTP:phosphocholine cytidylyltransferase-like protein